MNTKTSRKWRVTRMSVALIIKSPNCGIREHLYGLKRTGIMAGFLAPVGGRIKGRELEVTAAIRETKEESGFIIDRLIARWSGEWVANLRVRIRDQRREFQVAVFRFWQEDMLGEFKPDLGEFEWMRFIPEDEIPWDQFAPGDPEWLKRVIIDRESVYAEIDCGRDRRDLLSVNVGKLE